MKRDTDVNYLCFSENGHCSDPAIQASHVVPVDGPGVTRWHVDGLKIQPDNAEAYDDILKLSKASFFRFTNCLVMTNQQQKEDGIDLNRLSSHNIFEDCTIVAGKGVAVTCKGGSSFNTWRRCVIVGRGTVVDFEFANHSDQSKDPVIGNVLEDVVHVDERPVRVAWGYRGRRPIIMRGNVKIVWWWVCALHLYTFLKEKFPKIIR